MIGAALDVELARQHWEEGRRRIERARTDPVAYARLAAQVELVAGQLRRRVGQTFTLAELAALYDRAEAWVRDVVSEHAASPGWPRTLALVEDAAFHLYQRGAVDYTP